MPSPLQLFRRAAASAAVLCILGLTITKLYEGQPLGTMELFLLSLVLPTLLNAFAWKSMEEERERGKAIATESAAFSYYVLLVLLLLMVMLDLWTESRGGDHVSSMPLVVVLLIASILQSAVEWWKIRKRR
ncbi:hypothetical protein ACP26L_16220 [Paenibacillus sp. S-38]|uniref:hypothetical protein n=1 Tax=Paenibacillus sp. S-38 TaxID=3416710 RepID=UPI003CF741E0